MLPYLFSVSDENEKHQDVKVAVRKVAKIQPGSPN